MAKKSDKEKRRDRLERERLKLKKQIARDESILASDEPFVEEEIEPVDDDTPVEEEPEESEKSMDSAEVALAMGGPTSFGELDMAREMEAKNSELQSTAYAVEALVRNIVYHPMLTPAEKSNAIKAVGNEFGSRVESIMDKPVMKALDMDLLELEALIAKDMRLTPFAERVGSWISKTIPLTSTKSKLSEIDDKDHVRNALYRALQMIKRGGKPAEDARFALPKIKEAAKKFGIGTMEKSQSSVVVEKDASGSWRAVMWPSNNFKDWDGEIISEKAHLEYVDWVNKNMDVAPVFTTWHKPDLVREHPVDFVSYENGFLLMSAPLTEVEAAALLKAQTVCDIGMSHGSLVFERDPQDPRIINKYRMVEVSDLPLENAANPFTDFTTLTKEADMDTKKYLAAILGSEEKAQAYLDKTEAKQKALQAAGVENKEKVEEPKVEVPVVEPIPVAPPAPNTDEIVAKVLKELDIEGLQDFLKKSQESIEKVPVLEKLVADLSGDRDDWFAKQIAPPAEKKFLWSRPSQDETNVIKEGDSADAELAAAKAGLPENWLADALGATPIQQ